MATRDKVLVCNCGAAPRGPPTTTAGPWASRKFPSFSSLLMDISIGRSKDIRTCYYGRNGDYVEPPPPPLRPGSGENMHTHPPRTQYLVPCRTVLLPATATAYREDRPNRMTISHISTRGISRSIELILAISL